MDGCLKAHGMNGVYLFLLIERRMGYGKIRAGGRHQFRGTKLPWSSISSIGAVKSGLFRVLLMATSWTLKGRGRVDLASEERSVLREKVYIKTRTDTDK